MSKWSKSGKKILAGILVIAMVVGYMPQARKAVQAADAEGSSEETLELSTAGANKNMFDGFTADRVYVYQSSETVTTTLDEKGSASIDIKTAGQDKIVLDISEDGYTPAQNWGWGTRYGSALTDIDVADTFVYQTDFSVEKNGGIYFTFRATEASECTYLFRSDYTGLYMDSNHVELKINNRTAVTSNAFALKDTETHQLRIVSAPTTASVWIDGTLIFDNVTYDVTKMADFSGTGTAESPYTLAGVILKNTDLAPVIGFFTQGASEFKISNQYVYLYDQKEQVCNDWKATEANDYEADSITGADTTTVNSFTVNELALGATKKVSLDLSAKFVATDEVVMEFDITPGDFTPGTSDSPSQIIGFQMRYRKDTALSSNNYATLTERYLQSGAYQEIYNHFKDGYMAYGSLKKGQFAANTTYHYKIVSNNEKVSIWVNGEAIATDARYDALTVPSGATAVSSATMIPAFEFVFTSAGWNVGNIVIRKADGSGVIENVTPATDDNNLLNGAYGEITSSFKGNASWEGKSESVVSGSNFYTDLTYTNLKENGATSYWVGENFYPFGTGNSKIGFKGNESFVMSALVRVSNKKLSDGTNTYNHRVGMQVADYNGKSLWYFIDTTTLRVYVTENKKDALIESIDLNTLIGYNVGDYLRLTTAVTPFGFDIYTDGIKVYSYTVGDGTNVRYSGTAWTASGVEARFLDASVHYNYDNTDVYKAQLLSDVNALANLKGVYFEDTASIDAKAAEIKTACDSATTSEALWQYVGALNPNEIVSSGKVVNNMILDGTAAVSANEVGSYTSGAYVDKFIKLFEAGKCPFTTNDTWVIEADVRNYGFVNNAPRLGIRLGDNDYILMFQGTITYYQNPNVSGGWQSVATPSNKQHLYNSGNGIEWHVKYEMIKNESMKVTVTSLDGTETYYENTYALSNLIKDYSADTTYTFNPSFFYSNASVAFSNIYVGYDLAADVTALRTAVSEAEEKGKDLSSYTWESAEAFKDALDNAAQMDTEIASYVGDKEGAVYTTPYSKEEIDTAIDYLAQAELVTATGTVTVGKADVGSGIVTVKVATGTTLPTRYLDGKYFITGWTLNGEAVTTVADAAKADQYVAEYIDLSMLEVKYQGKTNKEDSSKQDIRFIASVNSLDYEEAGLVFSVTNTNPAIGGENCIKKAVTTVYRSLYANSVAQTAQDIYKNSYSEYLYAWEYTGIPAGATIYARAFVKLSDGTIVHGAARAVTAPITQ